eukprot:scaffold14371_cov40-Attheya_sp.AAC.3
MNVIGLLAIFVRIAVIKSKSLALGLMGPLAESARQRASDLSHPTIMEPLVTLCKSTIFAVAHTIPKRPPSSLR